MLERMLSRRASRRVSIAALGSEEGSVVAEADAVSEKQMADNRMINGVMKFFMMYGGGI